MGGRMNCGKCGDKVDDKRWFCPSCRAPLHSGEDIIPLEPERTVGTHECAGDGSAADEERRLAEEHENVRRRTNRTWAIRIAITVLVLALLVGVLLVLASRRSSGARSYAPGHRTGLLLRRDRNNHAACPGRARPRSGVEDLLRGAGDIIGFHAGSRLRDLPGAVLEPLEVDIEFNRLLRGNTDSYHPDPCPTPGQ